MPDILEQLNRNLYRDTNFTLSVEGASDTNITMSAEEIASYNEVISESLISGDVHGDLRLIGGLIESSNFVSGTSGWQLTPTGAELNVSTAILALDIPDTTTANSFHVESDGDTFWGANNADFTSNNDNATAYILKTGAAKFQSVTLSGSVAISGIANSTATDISLLDLTHDLVFSVTDADTIAWASGTITMSNGRTFSIDAGNTGNMAAFTYIYLSPADSSTVLQVTTTYSTAIGANKRLIGTAQNETTTASFIPYGPGKPLIDGDNIGALSIVAANIAASTITAAKMSVSQLSAISADIGSITAGDIVLPSGGFIRSGQTAFDTGTGFYLANDGGTPVFSVGVNTAEKLTFDGSVVTIVGTLTQKIGGLFVTGDWYDFTYPWLTAQWTDTDSIVTTFNYTSAVTDFDNATGAQTVSMASGELHYSTPTFAKDCIVTIGVTFSAGAGGATHGVGFGFYGGTTGNFEDLGEDPVPNNADVDGAIFWVNTDAQLFGRTANEGVETDTEITGITLTNLNIYRIAWEAGVAARFYVNGTLEATNTTNLPNSSGTLNFGFTRGGSNADSNPTKVGSPEFLLEN